MLLLPSNFDFCATLKGLPSWQIDLYISESFKIAKLCYLIMHIIPSIYALLLYFQTMLIFVLHPQGTPLLVQTYSSLSRLKLRLIIQNISSIYVLLFPSNFDFCAAILKGLPRLLS